ncbi:biotin--[acetyl-CoA-carboxylase] ligase [Lentisphaerota bacterium WC36G]|nr:biotin--[acetyl-CoA-carboxylase] ligase [Lentisphaerae bacterium WC36]
MVQKNTIGSIEIKCLESVDSTNRYVKDNFDSLGNYSLTYALQQTAGRGRLNRTWLSPKNDNVYASIVVKNPPFPIHMVTWICGLATIKTLRSFSEKKELPLWLKWPNDVYCGYKKISGILCEGILNKNNTLDGLVIGVGININSTSEYLAQLDQAATSLKIVTERDNNYQIADLVAEFAECFKDYFNLTVGSQELLYELWRKENKLLNQKIDIVDAQNNTLKGIVKDLTKNGEIIFEIDQKEQIILCGDIKIQKETIKNLQFP